MPGSHAVLFEIFRQETTGSRRSGRIDDPAWLLSSLSVMEVAASGRIEPAFHRGRAASACFADDSVASIGLAGIS